MAARGKEAPRVCCSGTWKKKGGGRSSAEKKQYGVTRGGLPFNRERGQPKKNKSFNAHAFAPISRRSKNQEKEKHQNIKRER
jgi:hypothetical protein